RVLPGRLHAAVGGRVVDDDDFVRAGGRCVVKRLETPLQIGAGVERDDDDRDVDRVVYRHRSMTFKVSLAARVQLYRARVVSAARSRSARAASSYSNVSIARTAA